MLSWWDVPSTTILSGHAAPAAPIPVLIYLAADAVVLLHFAFILFVIGGGILVWRWPRVVWLHLPAAAWGALMAITGWICPLTPLENHLRLAAGEAGYPGGFVDHYLLPLIYPAGLTREWQWALGAGVIVLNAIVYGGLAIRRVRRRSSDESRS